MSAAREQVVASVQIEHARPAGRSGGADFAAAGPRSGQAAASLRAPAGAPPPVQFGAGQRRSLLAQAVETLVIPRLVEAHRVALTHGVAGAPESGLLTPASVEEFARLILANEVPTAAAYLSAMRARGAALETLYLDLLAPAARHLGELWKEDLCDFTQVTTGLWRLQQVLREFSAMFHEETIGLDPSRQALLVPAPGEQHTFGLVMVAEFFRRGGWAVWSGAPESLAELYTMVRTEWFGVVGFSVACGSRLEALSACIRRVRRVSRNRDIGVMVGGPLFCDQPDLAADLGADASASDGRQAVIEANDLLARLSMPRLAAQQRAAGRGIERN